MLGTHSLNACGSSIDDRTTDSTRSSALHDEEESAVVGQKGTTTQSNNNAVNAVRSSSTDHNINNLLLCQRGELYKYLTADTSQICDGRNIDSFTSRCSDESAVARRTSRPEEDREMVEMNSITYRPRSNPEPIAAARGNTSNKELVELDQSVWHCPHRSENTVTTRLPWRLMDPEPSDLPNLTLSVTSDESDLRSSASSQQLTNIAQDISEYFSKLTDQNEPQEINDSVPGSVPSSTSITTKNSRVSVLKRKSQPRHRDSLTNSTLESIIRNPRYSRRNRTSFFNESTTSASSWPTVPQRRVAYDSIEGSSRSHRHSFSHNLAQYKPEDILNHPDSVRDVGPDSWEDVSLLDENNSQGSWVSHHVDFSNDLEVYYFKK